MRSFTLKTALAAILVSAPFASAFAGADRSDTNMYLNGSQSSFNGAASITSGSTPVATEMDRSSEGRR